MDENQEPPRRKTNESNPFEWGTQPIADTTGLRSAPSIAQSQELPLLKSARREALVAMAIWLAATLFSVGYCYKFGYKRDPQTLKFVLGFPDWVFWGLVVPWGVSTVVASLFALCFMKDEDLGDETPSLDSPLNE